MADGPVPANDQRRVVAATGYVFTPVVPLIVLSGTTKDDPYMRRHAAAALVWCLPFLVLFVPVVVLMVVLMRASLLAICLLPIVLLLPFVPGAVWGFIVYERGDVTIPVLTRLGQRLFPPRLPVSDRAGPEPGAAEPPSARD